MKAIAELATGLDLIKARAVDVLDPDEIEDIEDIAERVEERRGFVGDTFVAALAGGTGAGKSSLINALVGGEVASVSAVRPHTDQPLALVPTEPGADLLLFLDEMGIRERVEMPRFTDLALLDLPDQDSTAMAHREVVWDVLPEVDAIIWVADPDKYNDTAFLRDYIGGLLAYQDQALFVLNKADLLGEDALAEVEADFVAHLEVAGIVEPRVFVMAAAPPHREPSGVSELADFLDRQMTAKKVMASKTIADVARAVSLVAHRARLDAGWHLGFDERWEAARATAAAAVADDDVDTAVDVIDGFRLALVGHVGPSFGRRLLEAVPPDVVERELSAIASAAEAGKRPPAQRGLRRRKAPPKEVPRLPDRVDATIADPLRELLWARSYLGATLAAVAVQAAQAQARLSS